MKIQPNECPRLTGTGNPNDKPRPPIPAHRPLYEESEPQISYEGRTWTRTGVCVACGAAIYGMIPAGARYSHEIDPNTPLHHAI